MSFDEGAQKEKKLSVTVLSLVLESEESNFYSSISGSDVSGSETEGIYVGHMCISSRNVYTC